METCTFKSGRVLEELKVMAGYTGDDVYVQVTRKSRWVLQYDLLKNRILYSGKVHGERPHGFHQT